MKGVGWDGEWVDVRESLYEHSLECHTASCRSQHVMLDMRAESQVSLSLRAQSQAQCECGALPH